MFHGQLFDLKYWFSLKTGHTEIVIQTTYVPANSKMLHFNFLSGFFNPET
jgi:hypothetical protein